MYVCMFCAHLANDCPWWLDKAVRPIKPTLHIGHGIPLRIDAGGRAREEVVECVKPLKK